MRRFLIISLVILVGANIAYGRRRSKDAGSVQDSVYTDSNYNFSLKIPKGWEHSIKDEDDNVRLVLTREEYDIPQRYIHFPAYTETPKVTVFAGETSMPLNWFVDSLLSDDYNSKLKKRMLPELKILYGDYIPKKRSKMSTGQSEGIILVGERQYTISVQRSGFQSDKADVVTDYYGGGVYLTKHEDNIVALHFICEKVFLDNYMDEFNSMINSFNWQSAEDSKKEDKD